MSGNQILLHQICQIFERKLLAMWDHIFLLNKYIHLAGIIPLLIYVRVQRKEKYLVFFFFLIKGCFPLPLPLSNSWICPHVWSIPWPSSSYESVSKSANEGLSSLTDVALDSNTRPVTGFSSIFPSGKTLPD